MARITLEVEHALGAAEAARRIREAAEAQRAKAAGFVKSVTWTADSARVEGQGFAGEIQIGERSVVVDAELGFPANLMPLKARKEAEAWLRGVLGG